MRLQNGFNPILCVHYLLWAYFLRFYEHDALQYRPLLHIRIRPWICRFGQSYKTVLKTTKGGYYRLMRLLAAAWSLKTTTFLHRTCFGYFWGFSNGY